MTISGHSYQPLYLGNRFLAEFDNGEPGICKRNANNTTACPIANGISSIRMFHHPVAIAGIQGKRVNLLPPLAGIIGCCIALESGIGVSFRKYIGEPFVDSCSWNARSELIFFNSLAAGEVVKLMIQSRCQARVNRGQHAAGEGC